MFRVVAAVLLTFAIGGCSWFQSTYSSVTTYLTDRHTSPPESAPRAATENIQRGQSFARVQIRQPTVEPTIGDTVFRTDQARALDDGDKDAAYRVAQMFKQGSHGLPRDGHRMVEWLRYASDLRNGAASYQLYLYYLAVGLDRDAVHYENRALEQGFTPPPRLDPRRG